MTDPRWMRRNGRFGYWEPDGPEVAWIERASIHGANDAIVAAAVADVERAVEDAAQLPATLAERDDLRIALEVTSARCREEITRVVAGGDILDAALHNVETERDALAATLATVEAERDGLRKFLDAVRPRRPWDPK